MPDSSWIIPTATREDNSFVSDMPGRAAQLARKQRDHTATGDKTEKTRFR